MSLYLGENLISGVATPIEGARNIGQIVQSTIPLTDAGLHLLDGALISGAGSYADFVTYIAGLVSSYPEIFETEANWQTAVTTYGVCGKFVYDSVNNTVRLPKYNSKIYTGGGTAAARGNGMTIGLTNGTTNGGLSYVPNAYMGTYGATYGQEVSNSTVTTAPVLGRLGVTTDSTKSGIIVDLSTITTALDGYWYIVIATSTKTDIEVDIDEIATDLNGKADVDLTNCTKPHVTETYTNGTSWYRIYSDGWCEQGLTGTATGAIETVVFLKPFVDANYTLLAINHESSTTAWSNRFGYNKTTTGFTWVANNGITHDFYACGYIS